MRFYLECKYTFFYWTVQLNLFEAGVPVIVRRVPVPSTEVSIVESLFQVEVGQYFTLFQSKCNLWRVNCTFICYVCIFFDQRNLKLHIHKWIISHTIIRPFIMCVTSTSMILKQPLEIAIFSILVYRYENWGTEKMPKCQCFCQNSNRIFLIPVFILLNLIALSQTGVIHLKIQFLQIIIIFLRGK